MEYYVRFWDGDDSFKNIIKKEHKKNEYVFLNDESPEKYPYMVLETNNWNDYNYCTKFRLYYHEKEREIIEIGDIKILNKTNKITKKDIDLTFTELDDNYTSIGQNINFYRNLHRHLGPEKGYQVLRDLKDLVIYSDEIKENWSSAEKLGINQSLTRNSEVNYLLKRRTWILEEFFAEGVDTEEDIDNSFGYSVTIGDSLNPHEVHFDFEPSEIISSRINVIVGKNASGKTQYLINLIRDIIRYDTTKNKSTSKGEFDGNEIPNFTKIIVLSYSIYDDFIGTIDYNSDEGLEGNKNQYVYCGNLEKEKNSEDLKLINLEKRKDNYRKALHGIKEKEREEQWVGIIKNFLENHNIEDLEEIKSTDILEPGILSSGESILLLITTMAINNIEPNSLIIFDEPEIHLHPNLIGKLMIMFNKLLEEFKSYCIMTTHSPLIVQEIPSKYVTIFERKDKYINVIKPNSEFFGDEISNIVENIFNVSRKDANYKKILNDYYMNESLNKEEINKLFNNQLSYSARMYLSSLELIEELGEIDD